MDKDVEMPSSQPNQLPNLNYVQLTDNEEENGCFPSLNIQTRVMGLVICFLFGFFKLQYIFIKGTLLQVYAIYSIDQFYINYIGGNVFYILGYFFSSLKKLYIIRLLVVVHIKTQKKEYNQPFKKVSLVMYAGSVLLLVFLHNVFLFELIFFILEEWFFLILIKLIAQGLFMVFGNTLIIFQFLQRQLLLHFQEAFYHKIVHSCVNLHDITNYRQIFKKTLFFSIFLILLLIHILYTFQDSKLYPEFPSNVIGTLFYQIANKYSL